MSRTKPSLPEDPSPCPLPTPTSSSSFWHSKPSALLTAHRSTRDLPKKADVVIIGSGMTGASVAHHLLNDESTSGDGQSRDSDGGKKKKINVVMLEAREACWGATGRNGGHCQPLLLEHSDPSIPAFELANFHALYNLTRTKSISDAEFVAQPGVRAIFSLTNLHETEMALYALQERAPEMAKLTRITRDEDELAKLRVPGALGAVVTEVAARMWPYKLVARVLEDLLTQDLPGGEFNLQTLTPVTGLNRSSTTSWTVETPRGTIEAKQVILATNAYTSHLLPSFASLIVPVRGQMSALEPLPSVRGDNRLQTSFGFAGDGIDDYLIQRPNESGGHLMFGGGRQFKSCVGVADDSTIDDRTARYLRTRLTEALGLPERRSNGKATSGRGACSCSHCRQRKLLHNPHDCAPPMSGENICTLCLASGKICRPASSTSITAQIDEFKATHEWTGIMGFSRDDLPWIGQVPASLLSSSNTTDEQAPNFSVQRAGEKDTGLYVAAGFTGHGMPNTWLCGKGVAEMVSGTAAEECGVPQAYLVTEERVKRAGEMETVAARDWAEMEKGAARARRERSHSGYA